MGMVETTKNNNHNLDSCVDNKKSQTIPNSLASNQHSPENNSKEALQ